PSSTTLCLSLHDALPIYPYRGRGTSIIGHSSERKSRATGRLQSSAASVGSATWLSGSPRIAARTGANERRWTGDGPCSRMAAKRSEEHTSELQSPDHLVC